MQLASARDAKAELLGLLAGAAGGPPRAVTAAGPPPAGAVRRRGAGARPRWSHVELSDPPPEDDDEAAAAAPAAPAPAAAIAVGVALLSPQRFGLAVRVPDEATLGLPSLRDLVARAGDEVDLRVVGDVTAYTGPVAGAPRPGDLRPGSSVAHPGATTGTLGCFVSTARGLGFLSCHHVLAGRVGDALLAPGPGDGGRPPDRVGTLLATVPLLADRANHADVAVGLLDDPTRSAGNVVPGGRLRGVLDAAGLADLVGARRGALRVAKTGRTTGTTRGRVTAVEVDGVRVGYGAAGRLAFDDCVELAGTGAPFSRPGDSGSVVHTLDRRLALGLLFCGSATGGPGGHGVSYACGLSTALDLVGATLVT